MENETIVFFSLSTDTLCGIVKMKLTGLLQSAQPRGRLVRRDCQLVRRLCFLVAVGVVAAGLMDAAEHRRAFEAAQGWTRGCMNGVSGLANAQPPLCHGRID